MKLGRKLPARSIVADERGQALVEFILVTPVIIFFFFVLLQFMLILFATQLSNYAVFAAARVYCVQHAADADQAASYGELAAGLAMAPISDLAAGELPGWASFLTDIANFDDAMDLPANLDNLVELGRGYAMARYWRSSVTFSGPGGTPEVIGVTMRYQYPVIVPGFTLLWDLLRGPSLTEEFDDVDGYLRRKRIIDIPTHPLLPGAIKNIINNLNDFLTFPLPYVDINAKCTMGYEGWNGTTIVLEDANTSDDEGSDPAGEAAIAQLETCNQELGVLQTNEVNASIAVQTAEDNLVNAVKNYYNQTKGLADCYDSATNTTYCTGNRSSANTAKSQLDAAVIDQTNKRNAYNNNTSEANANAMNAATENVENKRNTLESRSNSWRSCLLSALPPKPAGCGGNVSAMNTARTNVGTKKSELAAAKLAREQAELARELKAAECEGYSDTATGGHTF